MWLFLLSSCPAVFPCAAVGLSTVSYSNDNSHMDKSVTRAIMYTVIVADSAYTLAEMARMLLHDIC